MPCYYPLTAYRSHKKHESGKSVIVFDKSKSLLGIPFQLACGQCIGCRLDRSQMWAMRGLHESTTHKKNCMVTMTYSDEFLPTGGSLVKAHGQKLIKDIRYNFSKKKINPDTNRINTNWPKFKYLLAGEYGTPDKELNFDGIKFGRPHYHACLFGLDFEDKEIFREEEGITTYTSDILEKIWGKGYCTVSDINYETVAYVARYVMKKINGDKAADHYVTSCPTTGDLIEIQSEYANMSRRPGLGDDWYKEYETDAFPSDFLVHKSRKLAVPKYYGRKFEITNPEEFEEIKAARKKRVMSKRHDQTPERLAVRERCKIRSMDQLKRNL